ncbi:MAG: pyridoxamine 5'-phosphate oxidase family protein [Dehalococcoidia bacterium]
MATFHQEITPEQRLLIEKAKIFFVASVAGDVSAGPNGQGPVNLSPKGGVPLHIIDDHRVAYLDYVGSGNETARHASADGPMTIMVMSMDAEDAAVVRLYGRATMTPVEESPLKDLVLASQAPNLELPVRQVVDFRVESTVTSCGYGVPVLEYVDERVRSQRGRRYKAS